MSVSECCWVRLETVHLRETMAVKRPAWKAGGTHTSGSAGLAREREVDGAGDGAGGQEAMPAEGQGHAVHTGAEELPGQSPLHAANLKGKMLVILTEDEERQHHRTARKRLTSPLRQLLARTELNQL